MKRVAIALVAVLAAAAVVAGTAAGAAHHSLQLRKTSLGRIVVDAKGRTLYLFEKDKTSKSRCYGQCAVAWPPALVKGKPTTGKGLSKKLAGTTKRRDGTRQLTYRGHPLYRFIQDANKPGSVKGQNVDAFGAEWYVVDRKGRTVHAHGS